jgi:PleD family two-component response regulator/EAL domain-containing protein (putative c-di-GMP-specific phosphodiesterase class I)
MRIIKGSRMIKNATSKVEVVKATETSSAVIPTAVCSSVSTERARYGNRVYLRSGQLDEYREVQEYENPNQFDLVLLHREHKTWDQIKQAITQREWRYLSLSSYLPLRDAFLRGAKVVLIDASFLPEIKLQTHWLYAQEQTQPALFFVSDRCDIGIRIQALQLGARRLFSEPVDLTELIKTIGYFIHPQPEPNYRVLIIAEDESKSKLIVELLHEGAIEAFILTEPLAIIDRIWSFRPDLVLMLEPCSSDVDNLVLTKLIREREESLAIPIVFISVNNNPELELQALQAGADDFITMPVQPQHVLNTIICRIERVRAIATSGVQILDEHKEELPDRKAIISQIEKVGSDRSDSIWSHGVIIIAITPLHKEDAVGHEANRDQLIRTLIEGLGPILLSNDYLARIGNGRFAVLIRRSGKKEVRRQASHILEITNYRLNANTDPVKRFGVSLTMVEDDGRSGAKLLQQGEQAANIAYRRWRSGYARYVETPTSHESSVNKGDVWLREEIMYALQSSSMNFKEQRFIRPNQCVSIEEAIELLPDLDMQTPSGDIYKQAAYCGAAVDFDRFICENGMQRLYENTHEGKSVRVIVRQSSAVLEECGYIEFIKAILRKLHIVGNGLVLEFSLSSVASRLHQAATLFDELSALGIGISLSNFPCNNVGYKALLHLKANVVRPRSSHLNRKDELVDVQCVIEKIHSHNAEIILPHIEKIEQIPSEWYEYADYIQAEILEKNSSRESGG